MPRPNRPLVIDARPRGPRGLLAGELVLGRPVLAHLLDLAHELGPGPVVIHARLEEHRRLRELVDGAPVPVEFATGPPPEDAAILRADRLYDVARLRRALRRGRDPESAVLWRLDQPHGLSGAADELTRRLSYQPLGRFWARGPAQALARFLRPTRVRPNAITAASGTLMLTASALVAFAPGAWPFRVATAAALAMALVLDTADGHLARLQGTASPFGHWLDSCLDELGDMALHTATAWAAFTHDGRPAWLLLGMVYAMGKYLFVVSTAASASGPTTSTTSAPVASRPSALTHWVRLAGHADMRWHLWIILSAVGRLDAALVAYAFYYPARALAGAGRKAVRHG